MRILIPKEGGPPIFHVTRLELVNGLVDVVAPSQDLPVLQYLVSLQEVLSLNKQEALDELIEVVRGVHKKWMDDPARRLVGSDNGKVM